MGKGSVVACYLKNQVSVAVASATNRCARAISVFVGLVFAVNGALIVDSSICAHMGQQIVPGGTTVAGLREKHR